MKNKCFNLNGYIASSVEKVLAQIGESTDQLKQMCIESELTIRAHCDSLRNKVDTAREIALENIHKASNTLMTEIDAYEEECLSSWRASKESALSDVADVSKRMSLFVTRKQTFLRGLANANDYELLLQLELHESNQRHNELNNHKQQLKAAIFSRKIASFNALPSNDQVSLGELTFAHDDSQQLPFEKLDISSAKLKAIHIRTDYDFLLPLDHGQRIVLFNRYLKRDLTGFTQMSCFDRLGRLEGINNVENCVEQEDMLQYRQHGRLTDSIYVDKENVAQCGPSAFVVCHYASRTPQLSVYDTKVERLRHLGCNNYYSSICCNSKLVFGMWDAANKRDAWTGQLGRRHSLDSEDSDRLASSQRIQMHDLNTLREAAFDLRVPAKYAMTRIMADERHLVAMSCVDGGGGGGSRWFMSIFDLSGKENSDRRFFFAERHIELAERSLRHQQPHLLCLPVFMLDGWLVVPHDKELVWFDKEGQRCKTSTQVDMSGVQVIYSTDSSLLFGLRNKELLWKP